MVIPYMHPKNVFIIRLFLDRPKISATSVSMAINAGGGTTSKITVLLTPEEVDQAIKKTVDYRPPGQ